MGKSSKSNDYIDKEGNGNDGKIDGNSNKEVKGEGKMRFGKGN